MEFEIYYSKKFEVERVFKTLEKMSWYREQGYRPALPNGISELSSEDEIAQIIENEFEESVYQEAKQELARQIEQNAGVIDSAFLALKLELPSKIKIHLTRYGVGGSYNLPGTVILSLRMPDPFKTLIHELVHLLIQSNIEKHKIEHWDKERIVDLITHEPEFSFAEIENWQKGELGTDQVIDQVFQDSFRKDQNKFWKTISK